MRERTDWLSASVREEVEFKRAVRRELEGLAWPELRKRCEAETGQSCECASRWQVAENVFWARWRREEGMPYPGYPDRPPPSPPDKPPPPIVRGDDSVLFVVVMIDVVLLVGAILFLPRVTQNFTLRIVLMIGVAFLVGATLLLPRITR
jgi:hypothetical protein